MRSPCMSPLHLLILFCLLIIAAWITVEGYVTWILEYAFIFEWGNRDYLTSAVWIIPSIIGHMATMWGHYYRTEREFQHSIVKVTTPSSGKQKISMWEHHTFHGYTVKYWVLVAWITIMHIGWMVTSVGPTPEEMFEEGILRGLALIIAYFGGYAAVGCGAMLFFMIMRRSMLQALGFTYAEVLPIHRWLGVLAIVWSVLHTIGYSGYYIIEDIFFEQINFYDEGRATMNIMGFVALFALLILGILSIPQVRRSIYPIFLWVHRFMTFFFIVGTVTHYPYILLWYYFLPTIVLFLVDRFVPKMIQARTLYPEASVTLNADADMVKLVIRSPEPMKPYYPGDYAMIQIPELGTLYHPFTIASYWPEDPQAITLFIRTYHKKLSWTGALARRCGNEDKRVLVKANVDGIFGDRRHTYLKSEVLVVFLAGAAITTFMSLIKAIAAQITASNEPLHMQFHLFCTFRTRSELHAYGSFLHQITRDPRFTSWLQVEIYVSRPDKPKTLMGPHAHVIKNDIQVPGVSVNKKKSSALKRTLSGRTATEAEAGGVPVGNHPRSGSADTVVGRQRRATSSSSSSGGNSHGIEEQANHRHYPSNEKAGYGAQSSPTSDMTYESKRLPTFQDANSGGVATRFAKLDLTTTSIMILIPLAFFYVLRAIKFEGSERYCDIRAELTATQDKICYGSYSVVPGLGHYFLMSIIGYFAVHFARKNLVKSLNGSRFKDIESGRGQAANTNLPYPSLDIEDEKLSMEDGNWDEGDVVYSTGRMNVTIVVERLKSAGIGAEGKDRGLVSVFGGGPDAFVSHVERQVKQAKWAVDFHRETWSP